LPEGSSYRHLFVQVVGYTGSEIESGVVEALCQAFDEDENESTDLAIATRPMESKLRKLAA
jgi:hypothetical protein